MLSSFSQYLFIYRQYLFSATCLQLYTPGRSGNLSTPGWCDIRMRKVQAGFQVSADDSLGLSCTTVINQGRYLMPASSLVPGGLPPEDDKGWSTKDSDRIAEGRDAWSFCPALDSSVFKGISKRKRMVGNVSNDWQDCTKVELCLYSEDPATKAHKW